MNSKKSWLLFLIGAVVLAAVLLSFIHGAQQTEPLKKVLWMVGPIVIAALGVFLSFKLKK